MERYNYRKALADDIRNYIKYEGIDINEVEESELYDDMFLMDSITANASGSYTFNLWDAEENLCHNLDLLEEACFAFGTDLGDEVKERAEACDVLIRCYLLGEVLSEVLAEMPRYPMVTDLDGETHYRYNGNKEGSYLWMDEFADIEGDKIYFGERRLKRSEVKRMINGEALLEMIKAEEGGRE